MLIGGGLVAVRLSQSPDGPAVDKPAKPPVVVLDHDHDGLLDREEVAGWRTVGGREYRTDPHKRDTDGDGLTDGEEAGPRAESESAEATFAGRSDPTKSDTDSDGLSDAVETGELAEDAPTGSPYYVVSNPTVADTDKDGIGDGDEYFLDMDPRLSDTDNDRLLDNVELAFGSDPTLANPDGDSYSDSAEYKRKSNPLSYDLTSKQRVAASEAGLKFGDCDECALKSGLRVEQIESVEYLAGHFVSGMAVYGDFRDFALDIWKQKFIAAGIAVLGLLPFIGDSSKAVAILVKFAKRGDRAERAVRDVTEKLPISAQAKKQVLDRLPSRVGKLPMELSGGPRTNVVYKGHDYVGITDDFARREAQHLSAGRSFTPTPIRGATNLSRGQARSIEQACIVQGGRKLTGGALQNQINSIDPKLPYYQDAVRYGTRYLKKVGGTCPTG